MKTLAEKIAVMQAAEHGEPIEFFNRVSQKWEVTAAPTWAWDERDYRVAPKKKVVKYKRFLWRWTAEEVDVCCFKEGFEEVENKTGFVRWIDKDWQTVEV